MRSDTMLSLKGRHRQSASLTGTVASHKVPEASKGTHNQDGHLWAHEGAYIRVRAVSVLDCEADMPSSCASRA